MSVKTYRIALIPGDGIGKEVVPAAVDVLKAAERGFAFSFQAFDWGCEYYLRTGRMMDPDGLDRLRPFDAILLGAIGVGAIGPSDRPEATAPDHVSLRDLLLRVRFGFDLYVNLRPVEILPGLDSPLRGKTATTSAWFSFARTLRANTVAWAGVSNGARRMRWPSNSRFSLVKA